MKPTAIGFMRADISGVSKPWDQIQIRTTGERFGYEVIKTIEFTAHTADPVDQLIRAVARDKVKAVVVPSVEHLGGEIPARLLDAIDVITVAPQTVYARDVPGLPDPFVPATQRGEVKS